MIRALPALLLAALLAPSVAQAQSYRCVGSDGKKHYGQTIPAQCAGQPVEQLSAQGTVVRRIEPQAGAPSAGAKAVGGTVAKDDVRRNRALLATYASEKDIEVARQRALAEPAGTIQAAEARIAELQGKRAPDFEIRAQRELIAVKQKELSAINSRYDAEAQRFRELGAMDPRQRGEHLGMEKGVTVTSPAKQDPNAARREQADARQRAARDRMEAQRLESESARQRVHVLPGPGSRSPTTPGGYGRVYCNGDVLACQPGEAVRCGSRHVTCQ